MRYTKKELQSVSWAGGVQDMQALIVLKWLYSIWSKKNGNNDWTSVTIVKEIGKGNIVLQASVQNNNH